MLKIFEANIKLILFSQNFLSQHLRSPIMNFKSIEVFLIQHFHFTMTKQNRIMLLQDLHLLVLFRHLVQLKTMLLIVQTLDLHPYSPLFLQGVHFNHSYLQLFLNVQFQMEISHKLNFLYIEESLKYL